LFKMKKKLSRIQIPTISRSVLRCFQRADEWRRRGVAAGQTRGLSSPRCTDPPAGALALMDTRTAEYAARLDPASVASFLRSGSVCSGR
jgi:hypothetical protein